MVKRGHTPEADKLLDYLVRMSWHEKRSPTAPRPQEKGIFEALDKQYLKSFIFAIYMVCTLLFNCLDSCSLMKGQGLPNQVSNTTHSPILILTFASIIEAYTFNFSVSVRRISSARSLMACSMFQSRALISRSPSSLLKIA
jgi:hypothetical protein